MQEVDILDKEIEEKYFLGLPIRDIGKMLVTGIVSFSVLAFVGILIHSNMSYSAFSAIVVTIALYASFCYVLIELFAKFKVYLRQKIFYPILIVATWLGVAAAILHLLNMLMIGGLGFEWHEYVLEPVYQGLVGFLLGGILGGCLYVCFKPRGGEDRRFRLVSLFLIMPLVIIGTMVLYLVFNWPQ